MKHRRTFRGKDDRARAEALRTRLLERGIRRDSISVHYSESRISVVVEWRE